jgi:hypothetical protein
MSPPIVSISNRPESFLPSSIPDLILDDFILNGQCFGGKLHSDSGLGVHEEGIIDELGQKVSFAHTRITDDHNFKQEIKLFLS